LYLAVVMVDAVVTASEGCQWQRYSNGATPPGSNEAGPKGILQRKERFHEKRGVFQLEREVLQVIDSLVEVSGIEPLTSCMPC
jgi:hypothetical protein